MNRHEITFSELQRFLNYQNQLNILIDDSCEVEVFDSEGKNISHKHLTLRLKTFLKRERARIDDFIKNVKVEMTMIAMGGEISKLPEPSPHLKTEEYIEKRKEWLKEKISDIAQEFKMLNNLEEQFKNTFVQVIKQHK